MKKQRKHRAITMPFAWLLILCLLMTCAFADGEWVCPKCGLTMTRKFCTQCGIPSPAPAQAGEAAPKSSPAGDAASASSIPTGGIAAMVSADYASLMKDNLTELIDLLEKGETVYAVNSKWDNGTEWAQVKVLADGRIGFVLVSALALGATPTPVLTPSPTPAATATPKAKLWTGDPTKKGNTITFGRYEQDGNTSNGQEAIEWIVISYDADKNQAKLLSRYGLEAKQYHHTTPYPTWKNSDIRKWLNGDFLQAAFTAEEQACIAETEVRTNDNSAWKPIAEAGGWSSYYEKVSGGNPCYDKIFLLSLEEAMECGGYSSALKFYDSGKAALQAKPTQHAVNNGAYVDSSTGCCLWWLRSPGYYSTYASGVLSVGSLGNNRVGYAGFVARPAFILNLGSE